MRCALFRVVCVFMALATSAAAAPVASEGPVQLLAGIPSAQAVAVNPQGAPYVAGATAGGGIARIVARGASMVLAETSGQPAGLAFDSAGDLYVADKGLGAIFRVAPWGLVSTIVENLKAPRAITVAPGGDIYVAEAGASRVRRFTPHGEAVAFDVELRGARGIVASADGRYLFVSGISGKVWRFAQDGTGRKEFCRFPDEGQPAGLALDEKGNLYVARDGGGRVSVRGPDGGPVTEYPIPGKRVTDVAFGGYDLKTLYVSEAETGAVYRIHAPYRSQRLPWEPERHLRVTSPADGAILNRHDGEAAAGGLRIQVKGTIQGGGQVKVDGTTAQVRDGEFQASAVLRNRENRITVEGPGGLRNAITVFWDRDSFKRYRFSTDDNIWFLRDIARNANTYTSIFQNPYLGFWREMHRKYGAKVHHNIYYETAGFNLSQMPDKFRDEWRANADWLRLSFHARANNPARPYTHASAAGIREDLRLVNRQIERFAGKELLSRNTTIHWASTTGAGAEALREEGVETMFGVGSFHDDLPYSSYDLSVSGVHNVVGRDYWKDTRHDLIFIYSDMTVNHFRPDQIAPHLERIAADPHQSEVIELIIHEEYFYPDYQAYEPDFRQRVERAIEWVTRHGYKPVFFEDGFLGTGK